MENSFGPFGSESAFLFHEMIKEGGLEAGSGRKDFEKGEYIFREDMYPVGLFCIIKGKVKIARLNEDGREQIVRLYGPNDIVGYKSLVMEAPYHASAVAIENTVVGFVAKENFDQMIEENPKIARIFMRILCQNLDESENFMVSLASKNIREKVAGVLVFLKDKYGVDAEECIDVSLSREEIAGMIGIATENLSRALSQFKEEKVLETRGRKIRLLNEQELLAIRGEI